MRKLPVLFITFFVQHFFAPVATAQTDEYNALLWEISGNGIKHLSDLLFLTLFGILI